MDLHDTITSLDLGDYSFWRNYKTIIDFSKQIMDGLNFLHKKKLCHLDVKPENIMVNIFKQNFKIIDFGFCSKFPFEDYVCNIKGTPGYFPKYIKDCEITQWLPKVIANDMIQVNGATPITKKRLVYTELTLLVRGRVLYMIYYFYKENIAYFCYNFEKRSQSN